MTRLLFFILILVSISVVSVWFVNNDGSVIINWMGYRIQTSMAFVAIASVIFVALSTLALEVLMWIRDIPKRYRQRAANRRKDKGLQALTEGLAAIAAGDVKAAKRLTARAEYCLGAMPITRLLSAQTAQMEGNREQAKIQYTAMLDDKSTEIIAIKGLLLQAREDGNLDKAIFLAEKALKLSPNLDWPVSILLDLYKRKSQWGKVEHMVDKALSKKLLSRPQAVRTLAVISLAKAQEMRASSQYKEALSLAQSAHKLLPDFAPATTITARLFLLLEEPKSAAKLIEKSWKLAPHGALVPIYLDAMEQYYNSDKAISRTENLLESSTPCVEGYITLAHFAMRSGQLEKARTYLQHALEIRESASACALMAELERREGGDTETIASWENRAMSAEKDYFWSCRSCGHSAKSWSPTCPHCHSFDSLSWGEDKPIEAPLGTAKEQLLVE